MTNAGRDELRSELRELVVLLRTYVEWQGALGATGFPRGGGGVQRTVPGVRRTGQPNETSALGLLAEQPTETLAPLERTAEQPGARGSMGAAPEPDALPTVTAPGPPRPSEMASTHGELVPSADEAHTSHSAGAARPTLDVLERQVAGCVACRLHETRTNTVFARGSGGSGVCFVGEGPGADEDARGVPFVGVAGQLLDRMIGAMGLSLDEAYICNVVKCRPPRNRKPAPDEMEACRGFLEAQLDLVKPEVIVALGATAVQGLLGTTEGITRLRGRWRLYQGRIAVMPTFHPAYLLRNSAAKREVWEDLQAVLRHLGRPIPDRAR